MFSRSCFICSRKERAEDHYYRVTDTVRFPRSDRNIMFCSPHCLIQYRLECLAVSKTHLDPRKKKLNAEEDALYYAEFWRVKEEETDLVDRITLDCERRFNFDGLMPEVKPQLPRFKLGFHWWTSPDEEELEKENENVEDNPPPRFL